MIREKRRGKPYAPRRLENENFLSKPVVGTERGKKPNMKKKKNEEVHGHRRRKRIRENRRKQYTCLKSNVFKDRIPKNLFHTRMLYGLLLIDY